MKAAPPPPDQKKASASYPRGALGKRPGSYLIASAMPEAVTTKTPYSASASAIHPCSSRYPVGFHGGRLQDPTRRLPPSCPSLPFAHEKGYRILGEGRLAQAL